MEHVIVGNIKTKEIILDGVELTPSIAQKLYGADIQFDWGQKTHGSFVLAVAISLHLNGTHEGCYRLRNEVIIYLPRTPQFRTEFEWDFPYCKYRKLAFQYARSYNKYLSNNYLSTKTNEELLCFIHPLERDVFERVFK